MTATPIPRTLAMTAYADLDVSVIDELPPGRTPVQTSVMSDARRADVVARIRRACLDGRQVYWVCPLIEESDQLEAQAAEETARTLAQALPELPVGLVHGRMPAAAKEQTCLLYTSDAADERSSVDLGGPRLIKKKKTKNTTDDKTKYQTN